MDVFTLAAKLTLDSADFENGLAESESKFSKFGGNIERIFSTAMKTVAAIGASGVATVVSLTNNVVQAYAEYEQLAGGVETLFKTSSDTIQEFADIAYKTAGISANNYMETVTSFSASLLQGLNGDTAAAAEIANQAIIDMSDNANKMGTTMESLQNAYSGFARNQFTMLDNLHIGYSGSREEMERLLADAEKLTGIKYDINNFADIIQAIHAIQEELGITGTTAEEAERTITGSLNSFRAAWDNLLIELGKDNGDIQGKIDILVQSGETAFNNLMPVIENAMQGLSQFLINIAPTIAEKLPGIIRDIMPGLTAAFKAIFSAVVEAWPEILEGMKEIAGDAINGIIDMIKESNPVIGGLLEMLINTADKSADEAWKKEQERLNEQKTGLKTLADSLKNFVGNAAELYGQFGLNAQDGMDKAADAAKSFEETFGHSVEESQDQISNLEASLSEFISEYRQNDINIGADTKNAEANIISIIDQLYELVEEYGEIEVSADFESVSAENNIVRLYTELGKLYNYGNYESGAEFVDAATPIIQALLEQLALLKAYDGSHMSSTFDEITNIITNYVTNGTTSGGETITTNTKTGQTTVSTTTQSGKTLTKELDLKKDTVAVHSQSMFGGTILRGATLFGWDSQGHPQIGGGEGPEAVVGLGSLYEQIRAAVREETSGIARSIAAAVGNSGSDKPMYIVLDTGALVGGIGPEMDAELGRLGNWKAGGAA